VSDLIQEQRAAVGRFEEARFGGPSVGVGALLVSEQLRSRSDDGMAAQLISTKGPLARGLP